MDSCLALFRRLPIVAPEPSHPEDGGGLTFSGGIRRVSDVNDAVRDVDDDLSVDGLGLRLLRHGFPPGWSNWLQYRQSSQSPLGTAASPMS